MTERLITAEASRKTPAGVDLGSIPSVSTIRRDNFARADRHGAAGEPPTALVRAHETAAGAHLSPMEMNR